MQVVLQVSDGARLGRRIWLRGRQAAEVGRNEVLDLAVPEDETLAETHFVVSSDGRECKVFDKSDGAGLTVNGEKVTTAVLADGDVIGAGRTQFMVRIQGAHPPLGGAPKPVAAEPTPVAPPPEKAPRPVDPVLLMGERSFRQALERLEAIEDKDKRPEVLHSTGMLCRSLAEILAVQDRSAEATEFRIRGDKLLNSPEVKDYLQRMQ